MVSIFVFQRERKRERELFSNVSFNIIEKLHNLKIMSAVRTKLLWIVTLLQGSYWWQCGVTTITTARVHSTMSVLRFSPGSILLATCQSFLMVRTTNNVPSWKYPANIYLFWVNNRSTRTRCQICSKLTIKTTTICTYLKVFHTLL